jgi:hypothetical protein
MKYLRTVGGTIGLLALVALPALADVTKEELRKLARAGVSDDVILSYVRANGPVAKLSPEDLIDLKQDGASEKLLASVLAVPAASPGPTAPQEPGRTVSGQPVYVPAPTYVYEAAPYYDAPRGAYYSSYPGYYYSHSSYYYPSYSFSYGYHPRHYYSHSSLGVYSDIHSNGSFGSHSSGHLGSHASGNHGHH